MNKNMTRIAFRIIFFGLIPLSSFATVESPVVQGMGGATRAGVPREAIFSNPASVASIANTFAFFHYELPKIPDFNAGGRGFSLGVYDGGDQHWKGGFGYSRVAKARILANRQTYMDRSEFRFSSAHAVSGEITAGGALRWIGNHGEGDTSRFLEGDVGAIFPLFTDMRGGITFENIFNKEDDSPQTIGVGATYGLAPGIMLVGDGYRLMKGAKSGAQGWALAAELAMAGDLTARAGLFEEAYRAIKGWSLGASWAGPRASFDYAFKTTGRGPSEKTHIFGITTLL